MTLKLFITGTDTDIGKTYVAIGLLKAFNARGYKTLGVKPISAGCQRIGKYLYNEDAVNLLNVSSNKVPYKDINPFAFEKAIAPHLAAEDLKMKLTISLVKTKLKKAFAQPADVFVIEGAGGWYVPVNSKELMSDLALALKAQVLLVVGMRLGCINHALLTVKAIQSSGAKLVGWVANCIDPDMKSLDANILTLKKRINAPHLGTVPYKGQSEDFINFSKL